MRNLVLDFQSLSIKGGQQDKLVPFCCTVYYTNNYIKYNYQVDRSLRIGCIIDLNLMINHIIAHEK